MAGYVIHLAVAQEHLKKYKEKDGKEFLYGSIEPDLVKPKSKSHYAEKTSKANLKAFLEDNEITTSFKRGCFLHLVTDYLFYNKYLDYFSTPEIYDDYDYLNERLVKKYNVHIIDEVKEFVNFKEGETKILSYELASKVIDEISKLDLDEIKEEVENGESKWFTYKKLSRNYKEIEK